MPTITTSADLARWTKSTCGVCKREFVSVHGNKTCSKQCRQQATVVGYVDEPSRVCTICGTTFFRKWPQTREAFERRTVCTRERCRQEHYRKDLRGKLGSKRCPTCNRKLTPYRTESASAFAYRVYCSRACTEAAIKRCADPSCRHPLSDPLGGQYCGPHDSLTCYQRRNSPSTAVRGRPTLSAPASLSNARPARDRTQPTTSEASTPDGSPGTVWDLATRS